MPRRKKAPARVKTKKKVEKKQEIKAPVLSHRFPNPYKLLLIGALFLLGIFIFSLSAKKVAGILEQTNLLNRGYIYAETEIVEANQKLSYGSESEIYRFKLNSTRDFSIRYLVLSFESGGLMNDRLNAVSDWKVYENSSGKIIGEGVEIIEGKLRVKLFEAGQKDMAYILPAGNNSFSVSAPIIDDKYFGPDFVKVRLESDGVFEWTVSDVAFEKSWGSFEGEKGGAEKVLGLPTAEYVLKM